MLKVLYGVEKKVVDNMDVVVYQVMAQPFYRVTIVLIECALVKGITAEPLQMGIKPPPPNIITW